MVRRIEAALLGRAPSSDERGRRPHVVGFLLALTILAASVATAVFRPAAVPADAPLVMSRQSGALFVRIGGTLHAAANLTSARLILGTPAIPRVVDDDGLGSVGRGPVVGIVGAPHRLEPPLDSGDLRWAVCENPDGTTTVGIPASDVVPSPNEGAILVRLPNGDGSTYLVYGGRRAMIDVADPAIERTFRLAGVAPVPVSLTALNLIPEVSPIVMPHIQGAGEQSAVGSFPVGSVLRVERAGDVAELYVVLRHGLQRIGRTAADLIRSADGLEITTVSPNVVVRSPLVDELALGDYPDEVPAVSGAGSPVCVSWQDMRTTVSRTDLPRIPDPVHLAQADGPGPAIDFVGLPVGRSADLVVAARDGTAGSGTRYLITGAGVAFPLHDSASATALGLTESPAAVPEPVIAGLPAGPELSQSAALFAVDVLGNRALPAPS